MKTNYRRKPNSAIVVEGVQDFDDAAAKGWTVLFVERFKPGVCRVHMRNTRVNPARFMIVFSKDEYLPEHWARPPILSAGDMR